MDKAAFFNAVRGPLFKGRLTQSQVEGMEYLLAAWAGHPSGDAGKDKRDQPATGAEGKE